MSSTTGELGHVLFCSPSHGTNSHTNAPCVLKMFDGLWKALLINGGPSGRGNRLKLPECIVTGVRELFPDPGAYYVGHQEVE
jgi:hypothetical protein